MRLAFTIGDPNGIGPEVVLKALVDVELRRRVDPVVVGPGVILDRYATIFGLDDAARDVQVDEVLAGEPVDVEEGRVTRRGGEVAMAAVARGSDLCMRGEVAGMVTAPISKEAISLAGHRFPGHTEFLARRTGADGYVMLMAAQALRVAVLTTHIPLRAVPEQVTDAAILDTLLRLDRGLRVDFGIGEPRIAMLGLNPHAGDGGVVGNEEVEILEPALAEARRRGIDVSGPHPADGFFGRRAHEGYDAVLACYHDQGLVPFKTLAMGRGVNVTLGLPIVRTSPDHGTAFNIAGKGVADPTSFIAAVQTAADIAERRRLQVKRGHEPG